MVSLRNRVSANFRVVEYLIDLKRPLSLITPKLWLIISPLIAQWTKRQETTKITTIYQMPHQKKSTRLPSSSTCCHKPTTPAATAPSSCPTKTTWATNFRPRKRDYCLFRTDLVTTRLAWRSSSWYHQQVVPRIDPWCRCKSTLRKSNRESKLEIGAQESRYPNSSQQTSLLWYRPKVWARDRKVTGCYSNLNKTMH